jgi:hypothetical protein
VRATSGVVKSVMCMLATWHPIQGREIMLSNFHALEQQGSAGRFVHQFGFSPPLR